MKTGDACPQKELNYQELYLLVQRMCNHAPDMIWAKDLECRYLFANQAICDRLLHAKDTDEPLGKTDLFFAMRERACRPADPEWHTFGEICCNSDLVVLESGQPGRFEEFGNVRGQYLCLDVRKAPFFDESGRLIGTVGCARDITQEKRTEQALKESEAKARSYYEQAPYGVFVADLSGRYLEVNPAASLLTGYSRTELLTMSILDLLPPESREEGNRHFARLVQQGSALGELKFQAKRGEIRWWRVSAQKISEDRFIGFCEDVTERRLAEAAMQASQARYRSLVEQSFDAMSLVDVRTMEVVEINRRFSELLGYELPADAPLSVKRFVADSEENLVRIHQEILTLKRGLQPEYRLFRHKNGIEVPVERASALLVLDGREYLMTTFRDMTMERRRQRELARDVEFARRTQQFLLPTIADTPDVTIRTIYHPERFVSGDSYHLEWRNDGKLLRGFLIDVTGHGLATAIQTSSLSVLIREVSTAHLPLLGQMRWINSRAAKYFTEGAFAAMLGFELDLADRELRYVGAGITRFHANGKTIETPGMFIGLLANAEFSIGSMPVRKGDIFHFLTDGFSDWLAEPGNAACWSPDRQDFAADVAALQKMTESGMLKDDATGISIRINA